MSYQLETFWSFCDLAFLPLAQECCRDGSGVANARADLFDLEAGNTEVGESLQCLLFSSRRCLKQWQYSVAV